MIGKNMEYTIEEALKVDEYECYDFLIRFESGSPLYFRLSTNPNELIVCTTKARRMLRRSGIHYYEDHDEKPFGIIQIPSTITYHNKSYKVTEIVENTFGDCTLLQQVEIPETVQKIGWNVFSNTSVKVINHAPNYTIIDGALYTIDKKNLIYVPKNCEHIAIPKSVEIISNDAFRGCSLLQQVVLPEGLQEIGKRAFRDCTALQQIVIPDSVTYVGWDAFQGCTALQHAQLSNAMHVIDESLFDGCTSLQEITFPASITKIEWKAFQNCIALQQVEISATINNIGTEVFQGCTSLKHATLHDRNLEYEEDTFPKYTRITFLDE